MNQRKADVDKTDAVKIVQAVSLCQCALTLYELPPNP